MREMKYKGTEVVDSKGNKGIIIGILDKKYKVRFEDGVEGSYHLAHLKSGKFIHPNYKNYKTEEAKAKYLGKTFRTHDGYNIKIIEYKNAKDITIEYEDRTRKNVTLCNVLSGYISKKGRKYSNYTGKEIIDRQGNKGIIIDIIDNQYRVRFEDGVEGKYPLNRLKSGQFIHPNYTKNTAENAKKRYLGKLFKTNEGHIVKVIDYNGIRDITIEYEDRTTQKVHSSALLKGAIRKRSNKYY